jgi:hypothetical protein
VGVESQDEKTPFPLIVELPDEDLKPVSKQRIEDVALESPISLATIRLNRHVPLQEQYAVHERILQDLLLLEDSLVWAGSPAPHQLLAVCDIIYNQIDQGRTLGGYGVMSGTGLKAELDRLRMAKSFREVLDHWVARKRFTDTISDAVERGLRFMRRYVSFTFPRHLMAVSHIQAEIYRKAGSEKLGDYSFFAARAESLFMEAGLFALDEYGVPPELARRLGAGVPEVRSLEAGLKLVAGVNLEAKNLHPFEREILADVLASLGR